MAVTVRLPSMLHAMGAAEIVIDEPVHDIGAVRAVLERDHPELARALADPIFELLPVDNDIRQRMQAELDG